MPTPNKYHPSGALYSDTGHRAVSATHYIVAGYIHSKRYFEWYGESRIRPFNRGIKKANRLANSRGYKFSKRDYIAYLNS